MQDFSECYEDVEEWIQLDGQDYQILNNEKIIAAVAHNDNNNYEDDNSEIESMINIYSHGEIYAMLVKWIEQQEEVTVSHICVVNNLIYLAASKRNCKNNNILFQSIMKCSH